MTTFVAIIISIMGILGLTLERRIKEMGIRKVLGASNSSLLRIILSNILSYVFISACISIPLTIFVMQPYLENYYYRISISPLHFILAGSIVLGANILAVMYTSIKAIRINPADALRYE